MTILTFVVFYMHLIAKMAKHKELLNGINVSELSMSSDIARTKTSC